MKNDTKIWLSSPHMSGYELDYVHEAFEQNWIAPLGANVDGFERDLEGFLGNNSKVAVLNSGTSALHLALILLGVKKDDYVICQSLTFAASANPIIYAGGIPLFVDSEMDTWNICPNALEHAIQSAIKENKKPKAIITVCLYGMPYKIDEIRAIANTYEIPIIEDSAEALGSTYKGENCGTFGDISVLSFNGNKIITTSSGGAIVLKSTELKNKAIFLANQAKDDAPHYEHSHIGYNYRLSNVCAGIGRGQMRVLQSRVEQRRNNHLFYQNIITKFEGVYLLSEPNEDFKSNFWLNTILIHPDETRGVDREKVMLAFNKANIESRPIWKPMHLQPVYKNAKYFGGENAEQLFLQGLCLPSGSNLSDEQKERIHQLLNKIFT